MKEREHGERNLGRFIKDGDYKSWSNATEERVEDPVNPFMKRVFEKRLRRLSMGSQNLNPNSSIYSQKNGGKDALAKIESLVNRGHECLEKIKRCAIEHMEKGKKVSQLVKIGKNGHFNSSEVIQNLEKSIQFMMNNFGKCDEKILNDKTSKYNSVSYMQHYECPFNDVGSGSRVKSKYTDRNDSKNAKGQNINNGGQTGNQKCSGHGKSIYECVLEERKNRRIKRSRVI